MAWVHVYVMFRMELYMVSQQELDNQPITI